MTMKYPNLHFREVYNQHIDTHKGLLSLVDQPGVQLEGVFGKIVALGAKFFVLYWIQGEVGVTIFFLFIYFCFFI